jgi:hypothetical protein
MESPFEILHPDNAIGVVDKSPQPLLIFSRSGGVTPDEQKRSSVVA